MGGRFVNKLTVDKSRKISGIRNTVHFLRYTGKDLQQKDMRKLIEVVFRNFEELENVKGLKHNREEITRLLTSPTSIIIIAKMNNVIIGYMIAEETVYNLRRLMHIYYIFTAPIHRGHGIASHMLNLIQTYSKQYNIHVLSLTFDTYDKGVTSFYLRNYFNYDPELRSYQRHDMFVKNI